MKVFKPIRIQYLMSDRVEDMKKLRIMDLRTERINF
jgi:hypothetical protein